VKHTRTAEDSNEPTAMKSVQMLISCYLCGWFIIGKTNACQPVHSQSKFHPVTGCIWVYRAYKPNLDDETAEDYCNRYVLNGQIIFFSKILDRILNDFQNRLHVRILAHHCNVHLFGILYVLHLLLQHCGSGFEEGLLIY
jgi:hypothetical protein